MLFKQKHLEEIRGGSVTLAFRKWKKPAVKQGSRIKTSVGLVEIATVQQVNRDDITADDALKAGFENERELLKLLDGVKEGTIYKIGVRYFAEDPRLALREQTELPEAEIAAIVTRLQRLDKYSKDGPWTYAVLHAISQHPQLRATDLATETGRQKEWLKLNVRKLKNLGLTISHHPGYTISPLGHVVLNRLRSL